jgi:membrane protein
VPDGDAQVVPLGQRAERLLEWARRHIPGTLPVLEALERETTAGGTLIAGGLAYRLFFWLLPFSLVVAAIASFWEGDLETAGKEVGLTSSSAKTMSQVIADSTHNRWYFLVVGLYFLLWFSIGVVRALRLAHFVAWRIPREKFRRPIRAGVAFTLSTTALMGLTLMSEWAREVTSYDALAAILLIVAYAVGALWAMWALPHGSSARWSAFLPGAVIVALGIQGLHLFTALYLGPRLGRSSELYGSLGAATVILLWLYIIARLFTFSAFLNAQLWERRQARAPGPPPAAAP